MNNLHDEQLALEERCRTDGAMRYMAQVERMGTADSRPGRVLIKNYVVKVADGIQAFVEDVMTGTSARRGGKAAEMMQVLPYEVLAFITLRAAINSAAVSATRTALASAISKDIQAELDYREATKEDPKFVDKVLRYAEDAFRVSGRHTHNVLRALGKRKGVVFNDLPPNDRLAMAIRLIEILLETTNLFERDTVHTSLTDKKITLVASAELVKWLAEAHDHIALMTPFRLPMLVPPKPWTSPYDGGYLSLQNKLVHGGRKEYLMELAEANPTQVYAAVNAIQAVPWRINKAVLAVASEIWEMGGGLAGIPTRDPEEIPQAPHDIAENLDSRRAWARTANAIHKENRRKKGKVIQVAQKLNLATEFKDREAIYFPHFLDWRGRAYPLPNYVTPQSDDLGKALLQFSRGHALGSEGWKWLAIHVANCYGYDKASFADRIRWTLDHTAEILDSALRPLEGNGFWLGDEVDSPFLFLAACMEWAGYQMQGEAYVSHINVQMDGAANGLQNLSALVLDEVGGLATGLVPSEKPSDIYRLVANEVERLLAEDVKAGSASAEIAWKEYDSHTGTSEPRSCTRADLAAMLQGKITRTLCKRPTMTTPYGVTFMGIKEQLVEVLEEMVQDGSLSISMGMVFPVGTYLADLMRQAIGGVVRASATVMGWLQDVAKVVSKHGLPIWWTTPMGLPVMQGYRERIGDRIRLTYMGREMDVEIRVQGTKLDKRKQSLGIAPNFIHSLDAAHLQRTVLLCLEDGLEDFAFIHDSFGTHAGRCGDLAYLLREAFIQQYSTDLLVNLRKEIEEQLEQYPELIDELPDMPVKGSLDLELVRESLYFFA